MKKILFLSVILIVWNQSKVIAQFSSSCSTSGFGFPIASVDTVNFVIGYDIIMNYDKTKVAPTGVINVSSDMVNPAWVDVINYVDTSNALIYISAFFNASAPTNANFHGAGNILSVEFNKTNGFGPVDTSIFLFPSLQESYITGVVPVQLGPGSYTSYMDSLFTARIEYWADNSPIKNDPLAPADYVPVNIFGNNLNCTAKTANSVHPDLTGTFQYVITTGENINIEKNTPNTTDMQSVINGADALLTKKVLLNDLSFIPTSFQMIAMDVNMDGVISAGDLSQLNQRAVLSIPEFRQAWNYNSGGTSNGQPSKDWVFIDSTAANVTNPNFRISTSYPLNDGVGYSKYKVPVISFCLLLPVIDFANCPHISFEVYEAILLGDVNGNFASFNTGPNNF